MFICFYLHTHQPWRIKKYSIFDIGKNPDYFDEQKNREYLQRIVKKSYLPTNKILLDLIRKTNGRFKVSLSITGTLLEQLEKYFPEVVESFQKLVQTDCCELISETYYHSLAGLHATDEFKAQIRQQQKKLKDVFGVLPRVFRNTELMLNNQVAGIAEQMGFKAILAEGADHILGWKSPNFIYRAKNKKIRLFLRNYRLSDDVAFRFSTRTWTQWPLTAEKYSQWLNSHHGTGEIINLFMDYETFGEHQWEDTGIFEFLKTWPAETLKHPDTCFTTPSRALAILEPKAELDFPQTVSWADTERDASAWLGNKMQQQAFSDLYDLENSVKTIRRKNLLNDWRKLQTADHFYYMCTKWFSDGDVHKYFNPHESPYEAFISFMNILRDLEMRVENKQQRSN